MKKVEMEEKNTAVELKKKERIDKKKGRKDAIISGYLNKRR